MTADQINRALQQAFNDNFNHWHNESTITVEALKEFITDLKAYLEREAG